MREPDKQKQRVKYLARKVKDISFKEKWETCGYFEFHKAKCKNLDCDKCIIKIKKKS